MEANFDQAVVGKRRFRWGSPIIKNLINDEIAGDEHGDKADTD
jgi:hypothetical protein